jgi:hypothetical protein
MEALAFRLEPVRPTVQFAGTMPSPPAYCTGAFHAAAAPPKILPFTAYSANP